MLLINREEIITKIVLKFASSSQTYRCFLSPSAKPPVSLLNLSVSIFSYVFSSQILSVLPYIYHSLFTPSFSLNDSFHSTNSSL
ncbi:hypothetical protein L2E82_31871 [Cichorium intybus]|uniref:Uncharacterized protein n=1 Tax=Cichorium intybus TaxID=13427 RepID=A0ACB9BH46_CICIN|nr:hypothetical protein L2E82_31871 [Cichorium intybus]